ncbi:MAG TPA: hypothetical protein VHR18_04770 [Solirubrobacterales bacterium]|nr:hypothetical protein [Solirubrobacterales bacterium]
MSKAFMAIAIGAVALAALVAGCGGGDSSDSSSATLTKPEFIKQADAICVKGNEAIEDEVEAFAEDNNVDTEDPTKEQQEEVIADVVAPGTRTQVEEISELGAPSGDEETIEAMVEAVESASTELEDDPGLLLEEKNPLEAGSKLAREYGLTECGEE